MLRDATSAILTQRSLAKAYWKYAGPPLKFQRDAGGTGPSLFFTRASAFNRKAATLATAGLVGSSEESPVFR
jgi:hypothetical protein